MTETPNTVTAVALLPDRAANKVKPKPSKREIIDALVELKKQEDATGKASITKELLELEKRVKAALEQHVITNIKSDGIINMEADLGYNSSSTAEVKFWPVKMPIGIKTLLKEYHELKHQLDNWPRWEWDSTQKRVRKEITLAIEKKQNSGQSRVQAMLSSPTIKKALVGMLKEFSGEPEAIAT